MRPQLIQKLAVVTEEEKKLLHKNSGVDKELYSASRNFIVDSKRMMNKQLQNGKMIALRPHTRFVDFPLHSHDYIEMMYLCSGSVTHIIEGETLTLTQGDILIFNIHAQHSLLKADKGDIGINFIILPALFDAIVSQLSQNTVFADFLVENIRHSGSAQYLYFKTLGILPIENLMENLVYSLVEEESTDKIVLQEEMTLLMYYLVSYSQTLASISKSNTYIEETKKKIMHYIRTCYINATLTEISSRLNLTSSYLSRWISEQMGASFKHLLVEQRFLIAEKLLLTTDLSVSDIVTAVGYENNSYFHKQFKKRYGATPSKWRMTLV